MTKEDIVKAYVWIRKNNNTIPDDVLDFMKRSAIDALNPKWIKIESENDLPREKGLYWVFCRGEVQTKSFLKSYYDIHLWIDNVRYYQPIQKPEPPIY